jgi:hypothetical protein
VSGDIVVDYNGTLWIYMGGICSSKVAGSSWRWIIKSGIWRLKTVWLLKIEYDCVTDNQKHLANPKIVAHSPTI